MESSPNLFFTVISLGFFIFTLGLSLFYSNHLSFGILSGPFGGSFP